MSKTIADELLAAELAYHRAARRYGPRSALATKLYYRFRDLKTRILQGRKRAA